MVLGGIVALAAPATTAVAHPRPQPLTFERLATVPAYLNSSVTDTAAAEISTVTEDGRTVVYTDSPGERLGFVDITNPARPRPAGTVAVGGEPTSVAHLGDLLLAAVDPSASFADPSGKLVVLDARSRAVERTLDLGGQPDSVAGPEGMAVTPSVRRSSCV